MSGVLPVSSCQRCEGKGWYWRTPEGFNPFLAGGWNTMRAMYKASCLCSVARATQETER